MTTTETDDHPIATSTRVPPEKYTEESEDEDEEYEEGTIATSTRVPQ